MNLADDTITDPSRQLASGRPQLPEATATGAPQLPEATATGAPQLEAGEAPQGLSRTNEVGAYEGDFPPQQPQQPPPPGTRTPPAQPPRPRVQYVEERPPNFEPIDAKGEAQQVSSFGEAAEKIREHAKPVYQRLDAATNGKFTELRVARDAAYASEDYKAAYAAEKQIEKLFDDAVVERQIDRLDYKTVKSAWRTSKILDAVHDAVSRGFNIEDAKLAEDAGVWRGISGGKLQNGINRLTKEYGTEAINEVLGSDGMRGLQRTASLLQTPRYAQQYGQVIGHVADDVASTAANAPGAPKTVQWARNLVLHRIATDPKFSKFVEYAVKNRVPQSMSIGILSGLMNQSSANRRPTIQDKEVVPASPERGIQPVTLPVTVEGNKPQ
jgi:hypothetical protein